MWTMASRNSAQPSQLGPPLPVSLRILSPWLPDWTFLPLHQDKALSLLCTHGGWVLSELFLSRGGLAAA